MPSDKQGISSHNKPKPTKKMPPKKGGKGKK